MPANHYPAAHLDSYDKLEYPNDILRQVEIEDSEYAFDPISAESDGALQYPELSPLPDDTGAGTQSQSQSTITPNTLATNTVTDSGFESTRDQSAQGEHNNRLPRKRQNTSDNGIPRKRRNVQPAVRKFVCPFYRFNPSKFCTQYGKTDVDGRFSTCAEEGWQQMRHLK